MDITFDKMFYTEGKLIGGVDESGVIDIAGPLVAACVVLPRIDPQIHDLKIFEIFDSKSVPKRYRKSQAEIVWQTATAIGVGEVQPAELDYLNRVEAARLAMLRAVMACQHTVKGCEVRPDFLLVDGSQPIPTKIRQAAYLNLDKKSLCCAAASIIAKVYRDEIMEKLHEAYPYYGWINNKGFPNDEHLAGIDRYGIQVGVHRAKYWPFRPSNGFPEKGDEWEQRRRRWRLETFRRLGIEVGEDLWTSKPPLWEASPSYKALHQEEVKYIKSMKQQKKKSREQQTREPSL